MGADDKLPEDPLLDPVFEDLTKGHKSIYDIPEEAVDTKSWIGKKQANAPESNKPKGSKLAPNNPEANSVGRIDKNARLDSPTLANAQGSIHAGQPD